MSITGVNLTATYTASSFATSGLSHTLGSHYWAHDGKVYKFVIYDSGSGPVAAVAGNVAYYYTLDGYKQHKVTSDLSDSLEIGAGVLQSAPADGEYCWIQIKGPATVTTNLTAGTDGDPLTPTGASDGTLDVAIDSADAAVPQHICAWAGDHSDNEILCDFPF